MKQEKPPLKEVIAASLKRAITTVYVFLGIYFALNIFCIIVGIRFYIIKGSYLNLFIPNSLILFSALIPFYFLVAYALRRSKGSDKLIKEFLINDPENCGSPFRDKALAYPTFAQLAPFTGLVNLLNSHKWEFFAVTMAISLITIAASWPRASEWRKRLNRIYAEAAPELKNR